MSRARSLALWVEQSEDAFSAFFRQTVDECNGVVGVGADDQPADFFIVEQRENIRQKFRRELF